jgi:hypothetical protein
MKKPWIKKFKSFAEAEASDKKRYSKMSPKEKWDTMQFLREVYYKFQGGAYEKGKGLRRVLKVIKQAQG